MRVQHIKIGVWRHFRNIDLNIPDDAPIVCMVGGNGTGKSQILELIAASAQLIGLSHGFQSGRGNPFNESADIEVKFYIASDAVPTLEIESAEGQDEHKVARLEWDRTLTVRRSINKSAKVYAGGISDENKSTQFAQHLVDKIRSSALIHYLSLDADRAYPKIQVHSHEMGSAFETDWAGTAKSRSFSFTKSLYEEWFKYLLGTESRENGEHIAAIRLAREKGEPDPVFIDKMSSYRDSIKKILPHLLFTGVASQAREIEFDSTGTPLTFDQLSGGEREIAFLVGQIERFGLRKGLLLVDEPELHLNYDLLRAWIGFLKGTVEEGQIWLATHSLEVVEVAGQDATFLLERDEGTRAVSKCGPISSRPVVSTLSRAVGSPAFSISNLTFVLVEGEETIGERERFRLLTGSPTNVRFIEGGNCKEVMRRADGLRAIAKASGEDLRIGGIIDGDWRSTPERQTLSDLGYHVLAVHEVENFFLHPDTIKYVLTTINGNPASYDGILQSAIDRRAASWIFNAARTKKTFSDFPPPDGKVKGLVHKLSWSDFTNLSAKATEIAEADPQLDQSQIELLAQNIAAEAKAYQQQRNGPDLWKKCEGKEVFRSIASAIGFADADCAERAIIGAWAKDPSLMPTDLQALREYVETTRLSR